LGEAERCGEVSRSSVEAWAPPGAISGADELAENLELLVHLRFGFNPRPIEDLGRGVDSDAGPHRQRQGVRWPGVDGEDTTV
jgi:hypothetical protein